MPASEERRGKWKRRRRGGLAARKPKQEEDEVEDEEEENNNNDDAYDVDNAAEEPPLQNWNKPLVLEESGTRLSDFPAVVRRGVIRPHPSISAVAAAERAGLVGETKGHSSLPALENVSYGQLQALSSVPADSPGFDPERNDGSSSAYVISPPPIMEGEGVAKRFGELVHVVPMHSDWFAPDTVNRLERQVVPHFFSGKSPNHTPEKYMEFRNSIVANYMNDPEKRLLLSDCEGLVDDIDDEDLARVFRFLDHWGIINYCATTESNPDSSSDDVSCVREDANGEVHVPSSALKSIDSLIKFDKPKCRHKAGEVYSSFPCRDGDSSDLDSRIREHLCEIHCSHCSRPLPTLYFQSQKKGDVLLCADCFHHGKFVIGHSCIDFIRVDPAKDYGDPDGDNWTDQETLLLLEAVELYHENWIEIAEHVGSKSKAQCILHFLRLPVEDGLLDNVEVPGITTKPAHSTNGYDQRGTDSNGELPGPSDQGFDIDIDLPFVKSPNPVMALVAFLASAVGPRIAASCAHASLAAFSEDDRMNSKGLQGREANLSHGENLQQDENSRSHTTSCQNGAEATPLPQDKIMVAVRAGLAAAATKAKLFADHEEREIQRLSANIVNHQLKRMELKLKQFAEIETLLMKECEQVEKTRQRFAAERARMLSTRFRSPGGISPTANNLPGMPPSIANNSFMNNNNSSTPRQQQQQQQQLTASSSSHPSIPGFSNNLQQIHPQMQFMARQQSAFSLGPRLPLNAIQTNATSTASPNIMFGNNLGNNSVAAPGNQPSSFTHPIVRSSTGSSSGIN
ncbi:PREDICTED: SWI/SNF complex subunit SWI3C [Tarenaya hassleriana]|uniref:SWI/SNF complex subunit SWI3C n=1 Tax=Tarenaya hassleriana TaxID=28532 RepID=UPI00053C6604|nr:PREDICTED: SWI/SNF complex subunit SWI3C [Tarenaya hassleriana]